MKKINLSNHMKSIYLAIYMLVALFLTFINILDILKLIQKIIILQPDSILGFLISSPHFYMLQLRLVTMIFAYMIIYFFYKIDVQKGKVARGMRWIPILLIWLNLMLDRAFEQMTASSSFPNLFFTLLFYVIPMALLFLLLHQGQNKGLPQAKYLRIIPAFMGLCLFVTTFVIPVTYQAKNREEMKVNQLHDKAMDHMFERRREEALAVYEEIFAMNPIDDFAKHQISHILLEEGRFAEAKESFMTLAKISHTGLAESMVGQMALLEENYSLARKYFKQGMEEVPHITSHEELFAFTDEFEGLMTENREIAWLRLVEKMTNLTLRDMAMERANQERKSERL